MYAPGMVNTPTTNNLNSNFPFVTLPAPTWGVNWQPYSQPFPGNAVVIPLLIQPQDSWTPGNRLNNNPSSPAVSELPPTKPVDSAAIEASPKPALTSIPDVNTTLSATPVNAKEPDNYDKLGDLIAEITRKQADKNPRIRDIVESNLIPRLDEMRDNPDEVENLLKKGITNSWLGKAMRWIPGFIRRRIERIALWVSPNRTDPYISWFFDALNPSKKGRNTSEEDL